MKNQVLDRKVRQTRPHGGFAAETSEPLRIFCVRSAHHWNPYIVGGGLGVLSWIVFAVVNQPLGVSTSLSAASGACAALFVGWEEVSKYAYWTKHVPKWDYGTLFLVGTMLGAFLSALVSGTFHIEKVPQVWAKKFGQSTIARGIAAFAGGIIVMYGARMAGGCTSGHGISGALQLALSSWIFLVVVFITGIATASFLFRKLNQKKGPEL
jgi:uncharacterized protein